TAPSRRSSRQTATRCRDGSAGTRTSNTTHRMAACYRRLVTTVTEEDAVADLVRSLLVALVVLLASWGLLVVLAKRLPPGILKDLAGFLPACLTLLRRLRADPPGARRGAPRPGGGAVVG